jgi:hypothetical protein
MEAMQSALQQNQYNTQSSSVDSSAGFQAPFAAAIAPNATAIGLSIGLKSDSFAQSNAQSGEGGGDVSLNLDRKPSATELDWGNRNLSTASQIKEQNPQAYHHYNQWKATSLLQIKRTLISKRGRQQVPPEILQ